MARIILFILCVMMCFGNVDAGIGVGGAYVTEEADYVPAIVGIEFGQDRGVNVQVHIYLQSDLSKVTNGQSSAIGDIASGYAEGSFTNCSALTPGTKYVVAVMPDSDVASIKKYDGGSWELSIDSGLTYPTFPANLTVDSNDSADNFNFYVKNAGGDTLLVYSSGNAASTPAGDTAMFGTGGVTCAIL